jgi:hypothetical protein
MIVPKNANMGKNAWVCVYIHHVTYYEGLGGYTPSGWDG